MSDTKTVDVDSYLRGAAHGAYAALRSTMSDEHASQLATVIAGTLAASVESGDLAAEVPS